MGGCISVAEVTASFTPLAFADLNGDGNPDIIGLTSNNYNVSLAVALGIGGGGFEPRFLTRSPGRLLQSTQSRLQT